AHFRVQYALFLFGIVLIALLFRQWRTVAVSGVGCIVNSAIIVPLFVPPSGIVDDTIPPLKIVSFNVLVTNDKYDEIAGFLLQEQPDLIFLVEATDQSLAALPERLPGYTMLVRGGTRQIYGTALFAREASTSLIVDHVESRDITGGVADLPSIV